MDDKKKQQHKYSHSQKLRPLHWKSDQKNWHCLSKRHSSLESEGKGRDALTLFYLFPSLSQTLKTACRWLDWVRGEQDRWYLTWKWGAYDDDKEQVISHLQTRCLWWWPLPRWQEARLIANRRVSPRMRRRIVGMLLMRALSLAFKGYLVST